MLDFSDPWWLIAVVVLVACWVMGVVVPVRMAAAPLQLTRHYVDLEDDSTEDVPPPPRPPRPVLPLVTFLASLGLVALSVRKRLVEPEGGDRWLWLAAAAGIAGFWALVLLLMVLRMAARTG